ncbi:MAG: hypothetical protein L6R37_000809 [Teloschistes peruensis]|nr:MAG: hypothetical protein L6R37_000809 [Teloschistes peruensis]
MSRRGDAFLSRRALIASIFTLFSLSLFLWHFPLRQSSLINQPNHSSNRIYDLYIEDYGEHEFPTHDEPSTDPGSSESNEEQTIERISPDSDLDFPKPSTDFHESAVNLAFELYDPYPNYNSKAWKKRWHGAHFSCKGPRGVDVNGNADDTMGAYKLPSDASTPAPIFGSYKETGLGSGFCFERHARNSPYGDGDRPRDGLSARPQPSSVDWESVDWGQLQNDCATLNQNRFEEKRSSVSSPLMFRYPEDDDFQHVNSTLILPETHLERRSRFNVHRRSSNSKEYKKRNAILLRTYDTKEYTPDNMYHIRSMVSELSLHSGGEYEVFLVVQIIDLERKIFSDPKAYQEALNLYVPREFHNISILFNVPLLEAWYPKAGKHDPNNSQQVHMTQPLQLFSLLRPEFDLYWQLELDVRYTGHHYHHMEAIRQWAQKQPRKLSWERSAYFYSPYIHRTWKDFCSKVQDIVPLGGVWGAVPTTGIDPVGPSPPESGVNDDDFEWGVGEPADFINISPIVDPVQDHMMFRNWVDNYPDGKEKTPRRAGPVTPMIAVSKRLLRAMHHSQIMLGTHMMPEMFPESSALQHGMKAVAFPEPAYVDIDDKTPEEIESIFNDQSITGMWNGGSENAPLAQHISYWWSAWFKPEYSNVLYRKWLGIDDAGNRTDDSRLCLPAITLHPIKGI